MENMDLFLKRLDACADARKWARGKTWTEVFTTCHRGDWLLWLFQKTNGDDTQKLTLAKAHCANTVRHLMKDKRSIKAVDVAIAFGEGKATREQLAAAAYAAAYAADYAADAAAYAAAYAADYAADAADYAADYAAAYAAADAAYAAADAAAYAADADAAAADADAAAARKTAREANQKATADICREYLPIEIWNI